MPLDFVSLNHQIHYPKQFALELKTLLQLVRGNLDITENNFKSKDQRLKVRIILSGVVGSLRGRTDQITDPALKETCKSFTKTECVSVSQQNAHGSSVT